MTTLDQVLIDLGANHGAGLAEELVAECEHLSDNLFGCNAEVDAGISGTGASAGRNSRCMRNPFRVLLGSC